MSEIRTFNRYNYMTGAIDGTLAYDFSEVAQPEEVPQQEPKNPRRRTSAPEPAASDWIREDPDADINTRVRTAPRRRLAVNPMGILCGAGALIAAVLMVMVLYAQVTLLQLSSSSVDLENQIEQLQAENDRLTVEYEQVFNLEDVQDYAVNILGMQEPEDDQIVYLTNVTSADRAIVVTNESTDIVSNGLQDILSSLQSFVDRLLPQS